MIWLLRTLDPLGPVDQAPDGPRDVACDLTASDTQCSPPVPDNPIDFNPGGGGGGGAAASGLGTLLVVLLVIALVAVIAWIVVSMLRNRAAGDDPGDDEDLDEELDDMADERIVDAERPPDRWRRTAREHREAGRFRDAVRCEYRALVGDLARAGHVDEIPGRTSGEERGQIRELAPQVSPSFDEAADIFDRAWFDAAAVTSEDDERFVAASTAVLQPMGAGR